MEKDKICPLCGQANGCNSEGDYCWCYYIEVPQGLLERIPEEDRGQACVCRDCIETYKKENQKRVLKHLVMWNVKDDYSLEEKIGLVNEISQDLVDLRTKIEEIIDIQVYVNINLDDKDKRDLVLEVTVKDLEALDVYQKHEEHQKVVRKIKAAFKDRVVIDYYK